MTNKRNNPSQSYHEFEDAESYHESEDSIPFVVDKKYRDQHVYSDHSNEGGGFSLQPTGFWDGFLKGFLGVILVSKLFDD